MATGGGRVFGGDGFPTHPNAMLWDVQSGRPIGEIILEEWSRDAPSIALSPDGRLLAHGAGDRITIWRLRLP